MEVIRVDGVDYRKVDREAEAGELIVIVERDECEESYENGAIAEVTLVEADGDVCAKFADGENYFVLRAEYGVLVEAYPQVSRPIEDEIFALKAKLAELEARVEAEKKQPEPERLKVGDYAKVIIGDNGYVEVGDIVEITKDDRSNCPFESKFLNGEFSGWHNEEDLTRATLEEVAEAEAKLAKVEEKAKWAKIGRKVSEFKVGDVVKIIAEGAARLDIGHITTVKELHDEGCFLTSKNRRGYDSWYAPHKLELIAPVESVVNLKL